MHRPAAHHAAVLDCRLTFGGFAGRLAKDVGLFLVVIGERAAVHHADLVVLEVPFAEPRPLLERHNAEPGHREFLGHNAARRSGPNDDEIDCFGWTELGSLHLS